MWKILKSEGYYFWENISKLDKKIILIFFSVILFLTISWYFANPKIYSQHLAEHIKINDDLSELFSFLYWFLLDFTLLFVFPSLVIKVLLKKRITSFGIKLGRFSIGIRLTFASLFIAVPIIIYSSLSDSFTNYFPLMNSATDDWHIFLVYEIFFILFIFSWEFIFRGYILFGLEEKFGVYAIFIQMLPFVALHNGKPFIETFFSIFGGLFLGYLAIRTRSIFYGFILHAFILISLDILAYLKA